MRNLWIQGIHQMQRQLRPNLYWQLKQSASQCKEPKNLNAMCDRHTRKGHKRRYFTTIKCNKWAYRFRADRAGNRSLM